MIVTSIPRSGSTKFCSNLSQQLNLPLYDEIFEYTIEFPHKEDLHHIPTNDSKDIAFLKSLDFKKCVINNHEISFFILENTDIFISRHNVKDSVWSWIEYIDQYFDTYMPKKYMIDKNSPEYVNIKQMALLGELDRLFKNIKYFYEYCIITKKEIIIPELDYRDNTHIKEKFKFFKFPIDFFKNQLVLPNSLVYE